jgi:SAM-dependent methyltransferase
MQNIKTFLRCCPICKHTNGLVLHTQNFSLPQKSVLPGSYDVVSCGNCGFCFADTTASQKDYDLYYNQMSKYEDKNTGTGTGLSPLDKNRMSIVADLLANYVPYDKSIVDVGCANGGMLSCLKEKGFSNLIGIDISQKCVDNVKSLGFNSYFGGIFTLENIKNKRFDCLIVSHVMEHIKDLHEASKNLASLIDDDGIIYIEVPDASRYHEHYFVPYYYFDCEHINHFNITALKNLFTGQSLECIYYEEKAVQVSSDKDYPVLRAIFRKKAAVEQAYAHVKDENVKASIVKYMELSENNSAFSELENLIETHEPVIVWGAGMYTLRLLEDSPLSRCHIISFIDKDSNKQGNKINEISIAAPEILHQHKNTPVIIASAIHGKAIKEEIVLMDGHSERKTIIL